MSDEIIILLTISSAFIVYICGISVAAGLSPAMMGIALFGALLMVPIMAVGITILLS